METVLKIGKYLEWPTQMVFIILKSFKTLKKINMKKSFVKLSFINLKPTEKVDKATKIVNHMTGNANFATPAPTLPVVQAAADALNTALLNLDGNTEKTAIKNMAEAELDSLVNSLGGYVQAASEGDEVKILSSGFEVRKQRTPATVLGPVAGLTIKLGANPGEVVFKWKGIKGGNLNAVVYAENPVEGAEMRPIAQTTKSRITISNLQRGVVYYFRIAVINSAGIGPWSEAIAIRVY